jgi:hypothetical protein
MQHYSESTLYVVATPIGNLADTSLRALYVLQLASVIACEDTRHSQGLLRQHGIAKTLSATRGRVWCCRTGSGPDHHATARGEQRDDCAQRGRYLR